MAQPSWQQWPAGGYPPPPPGQYMPYAYPQPQPAYAMPAPYQAPMMQPPAMCQPPPTQYMTSTLDLGHVPGVVIRQRTDMAEAIAQTLGLPISVSNKYKVSALPPGQHAAREHGEGWHVTGDVLDMLPEWLRVEEESSACGRLLLSCCGCANLRGMRLHFLGQGGEKLHVERPCRLGGALCCPLEMTLMEGHRPLGKVVQDYDNYCARWCAESCLYTSYAKVMEWEGDKLVHRYTLRASTACCGRVNNCCGATCCKRDLIMDVVDPATGQLLATVQKTYGGGSGSSACCRSMYDFSNFVLEFPPSASPAQRALLMAGVFHLEYALFEGSGDDGSCECDVGGCDLGDCCS